MGNSELSKSIYKHNTIINIANISLKSNMTLLLYFDCILAPYVTVGSYSTLINTELLLVKTGRRVLNTDLLLVGEAGE